MHDKNIDEKQFLYLQTFKKMKLFHEKLCILRNYWKLAQNKIKQKYEVK